MSLQDNQKELKKLLKKANKTHYDLAEIKRLKNNISSILSRQRTKNKALVNNKKAKIKKVIISKEGFFHAYKLICKMKIPVERKHRIMSELMAGYDDAWKVVGITEEALRIFQSNGFSKSSKMGIQRSHIVARIETNKKMFNNPINNCNKWWNTFLRNDKTILATSSENSTGNFSKKYKVNPNLGLFKSIGFTWAHGEPEKEFLTELWRKKGLRKNSFN